MSRVVWQASTALSDYFDKSLEGLKLLKDAQNVIELGAGTGLLGIFCSLKMAH